MNTINRVNANPYVLDPFDLPVNRGYMFPSGGRQIGNNNNIRFAANKELKEQTEKLKTLMTQIERQNIKGKQLNTII